ncbi:MAG: oligoendopeptidase F [Bacteroidetes bacterium GWF2_33_16]|nr:MAG: oligoendopeptidase F [Bacteroidetes bacterium GWE2_32_14]OFY02444.1 MAG: oligoendopeptidase F [Bacteroidetes bacterium GWF2_33_16]
MLLFVSTFAQQAAKTETKEDPYKYNWRLTDVYADWDAWKADLDWVKSQIPQYNEYKGRLGESAQVMINYQKFSEKVSQISSKLYVYASLSKDVDGKNPIYVTKLQELQTAFVELSRNTAWIAPELKTIPKEKIEGWMKENKELAVYAHDFDSFFRQLSYILDEQTQKTLTYYSKALGASSRTYSSLSKADMEYHKVNLSTGEEIVTSPAAASKVYTSNPNQNDRKITAEARENVYAKNKNTYSDIWMGIAQNLWAGAQLKGYESTLDAFLKPNNISKDVYMNLIDVAGNNTASLLKYRELRKKALKLDTYYFSDESFEISDYNKSYSWDEAVVLVENCLKPMGEEYNKILSTGLQGGWIDVYEKPGKQTGAYSWSIYGVHPFILMNWNESRDNVFTLAHELGHSMHSTLSAKYQPYVYSDYASMVAEVASTFNENMLLDYMIKNAKTPNEKIALLVQAIDNISGTFYRQSQFAEFEHALYTMIEKDAPINSDIIAKTYNDIDKKYNGDIIERSANNPYSWSRVSHFFTHIYYVYNYAVSFSASQSLFTQIAQAKTKEEAANAQEEYLTMLKSGGSDYPVELLEKAGVDLNTKEPFLAVVKRMDDLVNQLEIALKEAGKI